MVTSRIELPGGIELHFVDRGTGTPVILLHGGLGDCSSWPQQLAALSQRRRVIAYSRRRYSPNRNLAGEPHSIADDIDDLAGLQRAMGTGPAHLVGTSYGALVALFYALGQPAKVLSLALAEPPLHRWARHTGAGKALFTAFMDDVWLQGRCAFEAANDERALQMLADGIAGYPVFQSMPPDRAATARRNAPAMKALTYSPDPFPDLPIGVVSALPMPILLIRGERTGGLHLCVMQELARALPGAAQAVIANAGHGSALENPDGFNAAVLSFWDQADRPGPDAQANVIGRSACAVIKENPIRI